MGENSEFPSKAISLNMLERIAICTIAENAFNKGISEAEGLDDQEMQYISDLGIEAEKVFYEHINGLKNKIKFPKPSKPAKEYALKRKF